MANSSRSFGIELSRILLDTVKQDSTNLLFFLGGETASAAEKNTVEDDNTVWSDINFLQRVRESDVSLVVNRVDWTAGQVYYPYDSAGISAGATGAERNYYALTDADEVFLCLGADEKNRSNNFGKINSTVKPTRDNDNKILDDGYRWKFLYKLDLAQAKFKTRNYMPVVDISDRNGFSSTATITEDVFRRGCGFSSGETGSCCFYYDESEKNQVTGEVFSAGEFDFCIDDTLCSNCYRIARKMNRNYTFNLGATCGTSTGTGGCPSTLVQKKGYEYLLDQVKTISPNSNDYLQALSFKDAIDNDGQIQSVSVNLEGITDANLETFSSKPLIEVNSSTGTGGIINLTTKNAGFSAGSELYVIDGVELTSPGTGYRDITLSEIPDALTNRLKVSLDYYGGLAANPARVLNATKFMISVTLRTDQIASTSGSDQSSFNRYGLIRDVLSIGTTSSGATALFKTGSEANTNEPKVISNITKITADKGSAPSFSFADATATFPSGVSVVDATRVSKADLTRVSTVKNVKSASKVVNSKQGASATQAIIEVISPITDTFKTGDSIASVGATGTQYTITDVVTPEIKPFTGEVVASNSTSLEIGTQPKEVSFTYVYSLGSY